MPKGTTITTRLLGFTSGQAAEERMEMMAVRAISAIEVVVASYGPQRPPSALLAASSSTVVLASSSTRVANAALLCTPWHSVTESASQL